MDSEALASLPILPKISVRLTESKLLLAKPGLVRMWECIYRIRAGWFPNPYLLPVWLGDDGRAGRRNSYDPAFADRIMQLWTYLYPVLHGRKRQRLKIDFVDFSICALAVRALRKQVAHKHFLAPCKDYVRASRRLVAALENMRKRAANQAKHELGFEDYRVLVSRWQKCARWLQTYAFGCMCKKKPVTGQSKRHQAIIDAIVKIAERELFAVRYPLPEPETLRRWSRALLRNIMRRRTGGRLPSTIRSYMCKKIDENPPPEAS
jgi:hypothetical protein